LKPLLRLGSSKDKDDARRRDNLISASAVEDYLHILAQRSLRMGTNWRVGIGAARVAEERITMAIATEVFSRGWQCQSFRAHRSKRGQAREPGNMR
jgi:hypothetical protein